MTATHLSKDDWTARIRDVARNVRNERIRVLVWQVSLLLILLAIWEFGTRIPWLAKNVNVFDPFFVSQPSRVAAKLYEWIFGAKAGMLWPHLFSTLGSTFRGPDRCRCYRFRGWHAIQPAPTTRGLA